MILDPCFRSLCSAGTVLQPYMNSREEVTRTTDEPNLEDDHRTPSFLVPDPADVTNGGCGGFIKALSFLILTRDTPCSGNRQGAPYKHSLTLRAMVPITRTLDLRHSRTKTLYLVVVNCV
jgi:hypothetical protein